VVRTRQSVLSGDTIQAVRELPPGLHDLALEGKIPEITIISILGEPLLDARLLEPPTSSDGTPLSAIRDKTFTRIRAQYPGVSVSDDADGPALERLLALAFIRCCEIKRVSQRFLGCLFDSVNIELINKTPLRRIPSKGAGRQGLLWVWLLVAELWEHDFHAQHVWIQKMNERFPEVWNWDVDDFRHFGYRFFWSENMTQQIQKHWPLTKT
jgi:hypothetical protein